MRRMTVYVAAMVSVVVSLVPVSQGASYTSLATGSYNADGTWNEGGNPGGATVVDTVTINSPHTVTVTVADDASTDTVKVHPGGKLTTTMMLINAYAGAAIWMNGGILEYSGGNASKVVGGNVLVQSNSTVNLKPTSGSPTASFGTLAFEESAEVGGYVLGVTKSAGTNPRAKFTGVTIVHTSTVDIATDPFLELANVSLDPAAMLIKKGAGKLLVSGTVSGVEGTFDFQDGILDAQVASAFGTNALTVGPGCKLTAAMMLANAFQGLPIRLNGGTIEWLSGNGTRVVGGDVLVQTNSTLNLKPTSGASKGAFGTLEFEESAEAGGYVLQVTKTGATPTAKFTGVTIAHDATVDVEAILEISNVTLDQTATLIKKGTGSLVLSGTATGVDGTFDFQDGIFDAQVASAFGTNALTVGPGCKLTAAMMLANAFQGLPIRLNGGTIEWLSGNGTRVVGGDVLVQSNSTVNLKPTSGGEGQFGTLEFEESAEVGGYVLHVTKTSVMPKATFTGVTIAHDTTVDIEAILGISNVTLDQTATLIKKGTGSLVLSGTFTGGGSLSVKAGEVTTAVNLSFDTLTFNINGTNLYTNYGQLVTAAKNLTGTKLDMVPDEEVLIPGQKFVIVTSSGGTISLDDVAGDPIAEGVNFEASGKSVWKLSYVAGGGSDVEAEYVRPSPPSGTIITIR